MGSKYNFWVTLFFSMSNFPSATYYYHWLMIMEQLDGRVWIIPFYILLRKFSFFEAWLFLLSHPHIDTDRLVCNESVLSLFCKWTINPQSKPTWSNLLNPTVPNWATLPGFEANRNFPKWSQIFAQVLIDNSGEQSGYWKALLLLWQRAWKLWGRGWGPCVAVPLSGCCAGFLTGNSWLSSVSWSHLQAPAVNGSFTFSLRKQMHLDNRFLTAFSGIHHNTFRGWKIISN